MRDRGRGIQKERMQDGGEEDKNMIGERESIRQKRGIEEMSGRDGKEEEEGVRQ